MSWQIRPDATTRGVPVFRFWNPETGEIREIESFDQFVRWYDEYVRLLGRVAEALGPDVLKRWEDGDETLDLAAEVWRWVLARRTHGVEPPTPAQREAQAEAYRRLADLTDDELVSLGEQEHDAMVARREHGPLSTDGSE